MDRSSLTFKTLRNASYNLVGYIWPTAFSLFITPIIIFSLGVKDYGIYIFITSVISSLGLLDLSFGTSVTKHLAGYAGKKDEGAMVRLVHSANSVFLAIGSIGLLASLAIALWGPALLPEKFAAYEAYSPLFVIAGLIFFVNTASVSQSAILNAQQRFDILTKIGLWVQTLSTLAMLAIALTSKSLALIFLSQLVATVVTGIALFISARKSLPSAPYRLGWNKAELKESYIFGLTMSINGFASAARDSLGRLIIPLFAGPTNLTYYSIGNTVATKIPGLSNTLGTALLPMTSELHGAENTSSLSVLYARSMRLIMVISAALTITAITFAHKALEFWLSPEFADKSTSILIILALANFILAIYGPLSNFLLGIGKVRFMTAGSLVMAAINIIGLLVFMPRYGIIGAAWAYLLSLLPVIFIFYKTETSYLSLSGRKKHYARLIAGISTVSLITGTANTFLLSGFVTNLPTLLMAGGTSVFLFLILYRLFGFFEREDLRDIDRFFGLARARVMSSFKLKQKINE